MTIYESIDEVTSAGHLTANSLVCADCLEIYKNIEPKSIDLILTDLP